MINAIPRLKNLVKTEVKTLTGVTDLPTANMFVATPCFLSGAYHAKMIQRESAFLFHPVAVVLMGKVFLQNGNFSWQMIIKLLLGRYCVKLVKLNDPKKILLKFVTVETIRVYAY